jgi:cell division protein FtsQ
VNGDVFTANLAEAEDDADLVSPERPDGSEREVLAQYTEMVFSKFICLLWLSNIPVGMHGALKLNNGMQVEVGRVQDAETLQDRVDRLMTVYPQLSEQSGGQHRVWICVTQMDWRLNLIAQFDDKKQTKASGKT